MCKEKFEEKRGRGGNGKRLERGHEGGKSTNSSREEKHVKRSTESGGKGGELGGKLETSGRKEGLWGCRARCEGSRGGQRRDG